MTNYAYQLSTEEANYTHGYIDGCYPTLEEGMIAYKKLLKECIDEGEETTTDYIYLEKVEVELDENGEVVDVLDELEIVAEHTINPEPEN